MKTLLSVSGLSLEQAGRSLIQGLDLSIRPGACWMVIGPNGSGKTTLLKTLAGLLPVAAGNIHVQGESLDTLDIRRRALRIGLVFQHANPGLHNSTLELVMSGHHPHRKHWWDTPEERLLAYQALDEVGLADKADQNTRTLSGGELRRAEIARLLVQRPTLAMLDEPFNHLDINQQVAMVHLLRKHFTRGDRALLLVAHDLNMVTQVASHCLLLYAEDNWIAGPVHEVVNRASLSKLFHYPLAEYAGPDGPLWGVNWESES